MGHPYGEYEGTALWESVDRSLLDLEQNADLRITTARTHAVGYLCAQLARAGVAAPGAAPEVPLALGPDEALVLFEFLARFTHDERLAIEHPAEERALWALLGGLERRLVAPLDPRYDELLAAARARLVAEE